ncbi:MAG TPA: hypothetical protein VF381_13935, partial [Thermoanaerobaculia bacterium]
MKSRQASLIVLLCFAALIGCRHHNNPAPAVAPMASATPAPQNEVRVTPTNNDFVSPKAEADPLSDISQATEVAEQKG